ncbi:hypothetical protein [Streptomyces sp. enrichment culture]|uniref:hypothetical protein n=1 Tax=Streptomyces sp. enrichment culture TaxID=1795815 RepID=UPI003F553C70
MQYTGRSTTLSQAAGRALAQLLTPASPGAHPWEGWTFSAGWGTQRSLDVRLVQPEVVTEVAVDVARDAGGRWRHPARCYTAFEQSCIRCKCRSSENRTSHSLTDETGQPTKPVTLSP